MEKPIKDFEDYIINDSGNNEKTVWSTKTNKWLKPAIASNGYYTVSLCKNGVPQTRTIHSLIGEAFIPNPEGKPTVNHKNHIRTDNRVENLEWMTYQEQCDEIQRQRLSESKTGSKQSEETIEKRVSHFRGENHWLFGKHRSEETKKKISETKRLKRLQQM